MSIEFLPFDTTRTSLAQVPRLATDPAQRSSARRIAANRRNAQRSTGPRTEAGKKRVARNALKHGLCAATVCLGSEDKLAFNIFLAEIEQELQPRTVMQRILFDQIANAIWRLQRLPEAQNELFERELDLAASPDGGETLSPAQVLARRFSADRSNGFALMGRYEASLRSGLLRMLRQYELLKQNHPTTPYRDDDDAIVPRERAWSDGKAAAQRKAFADRAAAQRRHEPPRNQYEARIDRALRAARRAEQTQSKPTEIRFIAPKSQKSSDLRPSRKRNKPIGPAARNSQRDTTAKGTID